MPHVWKYSHLDTKGTPVEYLGVLVPSISTHITGVINLRVQLKNSTPESFDANIIKSYSKDEVMSGLVKRETNYSYELHLFESPSLITKNAREFVLDALSSKKYTASFEGTLHRLSPSVSKSLMQHGFLSRAQTSVESLEARDEQAKQPVQKQ